MGVPTSEVGCTPAIPRREYHEVHKDMWWHWGGGRKTIDGLVHHEYLPRGQTVNMDLIFVGPCIIVITEE